MRHPAVLSVHDNLIFVAFRSWRHQKLKPTPTTETYKQKQERMQKERTQDNKSVLFNYRIKPTNKKKENNARTTPPFKPGI